MEIHIVIEKILLLCGIVAQLLSHVQLFAISWTSAWRSSLSFTISQSLRKLTSIQSLMSSNRLILCRSLFFLPSVFPSIRVFSRESALCIRWPKYWSFSFSICPSNAYSGLISFRIDGCDHFMEYLISRDDSSKHTEHSGRLKYFGGREWISWEDKKEEQYVADLGIFGKLSFFNIDAIIFSHYNNWINI